MVRTVAVVAFDGVQLLDVAGPLDGLDTPTKLLGLTAYQRSRLASDFDFNDSIAVLESVDRAAGYYCVVATPTGRAVRTSSGLRISADASLSELNAAEIDTAIVPGALSMVAPLGDIRLLRELS